MTPVVVLGATGSIGRQALEVCEGLDLPVVGLATGTGGGAFVELARSHPEASLAVGEPTHPDALLAEFGSRVRFGPVAVASLAALPDTTIINGVVGFAGLDASLAAAGAGNRLGLANKESLVTAGPLLLDAVRNGGGTLIPIDSEHSAIFQCLVGEPVSGVARLILTASGGPFRGRSRADLDSVTPEQALAHPTWEMGPRITIDSATLANKGFEVIEAHHLFGLPFDRIDVVVHPQSVVHSLVEFVDGSIKAHLGTPDMRVPIRYAITHPDRAAAASSFSLTRTDLTFEDADTETFGALAAAYEAGRMGGGAPAALNAADEVAVAAFLDERIGFLDIAEVLGETLEEIGSPAIGSVADVREVDAAARAFAADRVLARSTRA